MTRSYELTAPERAALINAHALAERWWTVALRGVAALIFGVLMLIRPGTGVFALVLLFGAYSLVDGAFSLVMAVRGARRGRRWGSLVFAGIAGIAAGLVAFLWPGITVLAFMLLIAAWAIVIGGAEIAAAIRLRKQIRGEWLLGLSGALSIALGISLFLFPAAGALTLAIWIGAWALVLGALLIGLGFKLRAWHRTPERHMPTGGLPSPAH
jgi:uncharacterized membrane protein HdeD (DUF308 family)